MRKTLALSIYVEHFNDYFLNEMLTCRFGSNKLKFPRQEMLTHKFATNFTLTLLVL